MQQGLQIAVSAVRHVDDGAAAVGQGAGDVPLNKAWDVQGADRPYAPGSMVPAHLNAVARRGTPCLPQEAWSSEPSMS